MLIPAHNEELVIEHTLMSLFDSDFPKDKLDVIVMDDASTDRTAEILDGLCRQYPACGSVHVPRGEGGTGKAAVLNRAVSWPATR